MSALILVLLIVLVLFLSIITVKQGTVAVITMFGKYRRILYPGLNFRIPLLEVVFKKISVQNRSIELDFQAITQDQANVYFKAMLLYSVVDNKEETLKNVAFKFVNERDQQWLVIGEGKVTWIIPPISKHIFFCPEMKDT